jgi:hypothetical protein
LPEVFLEGKLENRGGTSSIPFHKLQDGFSTFYPPGGPDLHDTVCCHGIGKPGTPEDIKPRQKAGDKPGTKSISSP